MTARISPLWWPVLAVASPVLVPLMLHRNRAFAKNRIKAEKLNRSRIDGASRLDLPPLDYLEITVLSEFKTREGFLGEPGVSYLVKTPEGSVLFDVGFGPQNRTLAHNAAKLGVRLEQVDALAISHLHPDHMGGMEAARSKRVAVPAELRPANGKPCYLPDAASAEGFVAEIVASRKMLAAGIGTTGPLARSLFFLGFCEEQALMAHIKNKGLVVITGCGHPLDATDARNHLVHLHAQLPKLTGKLLIVVGGHPQPLGNLDVFQAAVHRLGQAAQDFGDGLGFVGGLDLVRDDMQFVLFDLEDWHGLSPAFDGP